MAIFLFGWVGVGLAFLMDSHEGCCYFDLGVIFCVSSIGVVSTGVLVFGHFLMEPYEGGQCRFFTQRAVIFYQGAFFVHYLMERYQEDGHNAASLPSAHPTLHQRLLSTTTPQPFIHSRSAK